jgi:exonuclease III
VNIGTINIGTLNDKSEEIVDMMTNRNLKILGLAETRHKGSGHKQIHDSYELFYSGILDDTRHGVGLVIHPELACFVDKIYNVSNRIIAVTMNLSNYKLSIIQSYAPQQGRPQEEKEDFYLLLQDTIDNLPIDSDFIVMGDLNSHVGSAKVDDVVGDFGIGMRNAEGDALVDFCIRNNLSIMNTFFKHQESHQYTWYRYNSQLGVYDQKTQIDFILASKKSIIKDVKAIPSESLDSDHRLVKGKLKIHLPEKPKNIVRKRVKVENIPDKKQEIQQAVQDKADDIPSENIEEYWSNLRNHIQDIQENVIGMKTVGKTKKKKTGWWTEEVKEEVRKKNLLFKQWLKERTPESRENTSIIPRSMLKATCGQKLDKIWKLI